MKSRFERFLNWFLWFSIALLILTVACRCAYGQLANAIGGNESVLVIQSVDSQGTVDQWLLVESYDPYFPAHGFTPSHTHIFTSKRPMFRQVGTQWEIIFP